jgi:IS605 OrfB family transposase
MTYKFRLKDSGKRDRLKALAFQVNLVWNYSNEIIRKRWKESRFHTNRPDLNPLIAGTSKELDINSQTVQAVAYECLLRTQKAKKNVRWRSSKNGLGWVPFNGQTFKFHGGYCEYNGLKFRLWEHRNLPPSAKIKTGCFVEDARGRWYLCLQCELSDEDFYLKEAKKEAVGIDPGLKTIMTLSDGKKYERDNITLKYATELANAQGRKKKKKKKKINAKIKNIRSDFNHKATHEIASNYRLIFMGNLNSAGIGKTRMAKGIYDSSIYQIKTLLEYKARRHRGLMTLVSEQNTTNTCSTCLQKTGPSGLSGLGIREWTCENCDSVHDRDHNSAVLILRRGHATLSEESNSFTAREAPTSSSRARSGRMSQRGCDE